MTADELQALYETHRPAFLLKAEVEWESIYRKLKAAEKMEITLRIAVAALREWEAANG